MEEIQKSSRNKPRRRDGPKFHGNKSKNAATNSIENSNKLGGKSVSNRGKELTPGQESGSETNEGSKKTNSRRPANRNKRNKRKRDRNRNSENDEFKLVMRLLPPNITEQSFKKTIEAVLGEDMFAKWKITDFYYVKGHYSSKLFTPPTYSRAYLTFQTMENLNDFSQKCHKISFVDDRDNATTAKFKISFYVKKLNNNQHNPKLNMEGTLENDELFKNFMKSMKLMEDKEHPEFAFNTFSILKPIEKEFAKQKMAEKLIEKKTEAALFYLAGSNEKEKRKKKKSKKKTAEGDRPKKSKKRSRQKKRKAFAEDVQASVPKNNNIVILEAAGKKELQKRKRLQLQKEVTSNKVHESKGPSKTNSKPKSSLRSYNANESMSKNPGKRAEPVKVLRRETS
ncbi:hypothetical protein KAFR_0C01160 [Kazachstania africana CBS 2517]|uniref:UPF3 domain-containing protein n=1 Tax=Kazachstania africana (strain ATCC 22294 / BCRC 22015 / CBS 2517 / CECT 1963 / NBRC 1671 / NRRL Y-8276) TaxID=1071382 RepID=H2ARW1_KAZAF|nr:hypothetical protein KAFR_0C01160 [Kazachstania africana CBS 2517]CCF57111.1 hypothetical protein KAFR_0C01160 [Kazachstania africana CBS 2517]